MEEKQILELAREALTARLDDDVTRAHAAVQRLSDEHGPEGLGRALMAWGSTAIVNSGITSPPQGFSTMSFRNVETGEYTSADETPAPVRWGGRFLMAMLAEDLDQIQALFDSVEDSEQSSLNVTTLLSMCAIAIRDGIERLQVPGDDRIEACDDQL